MSGAEAMAGRGMGLHRSPNRDSSWPIISACQTHPRYALATAYDYGCRCEACRAYRYEYGRAWHKDRYKADPGYKARLVEEQCASRKADPTYNERARARYKAREKRKIEVDPQHRAKLIAKERARREADPEYRAHVYARNAAWRKHNRGRVNAYERKRRAAAACL